MEKVTVQKIKNLKFQQQKITMLTAYDYLLAEILDENEVDIVLVGDSLGNVALGYRNTIPVGMTEMVIHTQAVARAVRRALVVADMPFGSYQQDDDRAVANAIKLVKAGAEAVKIEGAGYITAIKKIIKAGIPVMGHIGFTPQSVNLLGHRKQGKDPESKVRLRQEAKKLEKAGCFALVLEMVEESLAKEITKAIKIPTIGIGSGRNVDGQVLVTADLLGLYKNPPSFVEKYVDLRKIIGAAVRKFVRQNR